MILAIVVIVVTASSAVLWSFSGTGGKPLGQVIRLTLEGRSATAQPASDIFVVNGTLGNDEGLKELINFMGEHELLFYKSEMIGKNSGPNGLITRDDVVLIKVNSQWDERGGTNTDLLKALIDAIVNHPDGFVGEIVVADNGQAQFGSAGRGGSLNWTNNNAENRSQSVQRVVNMFSGSHKVSTYLWDTITENRVVEYSEGNMNDGYVVNETTNSVTGIKVSYPKFRTKIGTYISFKEGIWNPATQSYDSERLKVINFPVLKSHSGYGVTACVKHYMGVISDKLTRSLGARTHNTVGNGGMGTEMAETRMPVLNILDAIWINAIPGSGPGTPYEEATRVNVVMASTDPIALDYWAAKHVLLQTANLKRSTHTDSINPDIQAQGSFGYWLRRSMEEIRKAGYYATVDERHMNVYVTHLSR